eukprot:2085847-Amphidinium_carterae.1
MQNMSSVHILCKDISCRRALYVEQCAVVQHLGIQGQSRETDSSHNVSCGIPDTEAASAAMPASNMPQHASTHSLSERTSSGGTSPYNRWNELSDGCTSAAASSKG